jgi:periplasmic copper chaperone A
MRLTPLLLAGFLALAASTVYAAEYKAGSIEISEPWSRATPKGASTGAGYMKITNTGTTPDRLVSESSDIARSVEFHETTVENGIARMRSLKSGVEIKPGETVEFKPGSYHVMFVGMEKPLAAGDHVKATLTFENAGKVDIDYDVLAIGANPGQKQNTKGMPGMPGMPGMKH